MYYIQSELFIFLVFHLIVLIYHSSGNWFTEDYYFEIDFSHYVSRVFPSPRPRSFNVCTTILPSSRFVYGIWYIFMAF